MIFKNLKKRVSLFANDGEFFYIVDEANRFLVFDRDLLLVGGFKINFPNNKPSEKSVKIDKDFNYLAVGVNKSIGIYDIKSKQHIVTFKTDDEVLSLDIENDYLISGGIKGEIRLFNIQTKQEIGVVARHKDFITDLKIDSEINECYAASFDKCVLFCNLITFEKKERYLHLKPVKKIDKKNFLISSDAISDIIKWEYSNKKDSVAFYKEFKDFWIDEAYLLVLLNNKIALYDLEKEVILNENFLEIEEGDKIAVFRNYLLVSDIKGILYKFDLFEDEKTFLNLILKEDFKRAFEIVDKNPFLKRSAAYKKMILIIEKLIKKAKLYFEIDRQKSIEILNKLLLVPQLRGKIERIINDFENILKFKAALKNKNYYLAYEIVQKYPLLKDTKYYLILEKKWQLAFERALKFLKEGNKLKAKEILTPFMSISIKRGLIEILLNNPDVIFELRKKLSKKDYKGFFEIIEKYPQLKESLEYKKIIEFAKNALKRAYSLFEKGEFVKAKKLCNILLDFLDFKEEAANLLEKIKIAEKFESLVKNKEYEKAFEISLKYEFLKGLQIYKEFMQIFYNKFKNGEKLIAQNKKYEAIEELKSIKNKYTLNRIKKLKIL